MNESVNIPRHFGPRMAAERGRRAGLVGPVGIVIAMTAIPSAEAAFSLIDNFDSYAASTPIHGQGEWQAEAQTSATAAGVAVDPLNPANQVLSIGEGGFQGGRLGHRETINTDPRLRLVQGSDATYFFRMAWDIQQVNLSIGMSDVPNPISDTIFNTFEQFESQLRIEFTPGFDELDVRHGGSFQTLTDLAGPLKWYNIWMVVDNAIDTTEVYIQGGDFPDQKQLDAQGLTQFGFRNGFGTNDLMTFFIATGRNTSNQPPNPTENTGPVYIDDLYVDLAGENLANPIPEPGAAGLALIAMAGMLIASRRRR